MQSSKIFGSYLEFVIFENLFASMNSINRNCTLLVYDNEAEFEFVPVMSDEFDTMSFVAGSNAVDANRIPVCCIASDATEIQL